jgi:NAD(P)-dependent dehydrogenase (short-subunit alcohol dehydrogenase family)
MKLSGSVVLITGANRGIGFAFAKAALARGARRVYAAARNPAQISLAGVEPLKFGRNPRQRRWLRRPSTRWRQA